MDQKRKSIKQMSKMVKADDSADLEDMKPHKFKTNDGAQLQSMVSINQVTDADEPTPKNQRETS